MASQKETGRPMKFTDPAEMQQKIDQYFAECDPHISKRKVFITKAVGSGGAWAEEEYITEQEPYTITGLALALNTNRFTLINYENPDHYQESVPVEVRDSLIDTVKNAKLRVHQYAEKHLFRNTQATGAIFALKNNFGWKDESEVTSRTVKEDLDDLDGINEQKQHVAKKASEELGAANASGSPAQ